MVFRRFVQPPFRFNSVPFRLSREPQLSPCTVPFIHLSDISILPYSVVSSSIPSIILSANLLNLPSVSSGIQFPFRSVPLTNNSLFYPSIHLQHICSVNSRHSINFPTLNSCQFPFCSIPLSIYICSVHLSIQTTPIPSVQFKFLLTIRSSISVPSAQHSVSSIHPSTHYTLIPSFHAINSIPLH